MVQTRSPVGRVEMRSPVGGVGVRSQAKPYLKKLQLIAIFWRNYRNYVMPVFSIDSEIAV
jgi:hypothetical protein